MRRYLFPLIALYLFTSSQAAMAQEAQRIQGNKVEEGFATLWKEASNGALVEVLDNVKEGKVGLPLAYWTRWDMRDGILHKTQCRVVGPGDEIITEYEQKPSVAAASGYWYCALTRFQTDLDDLPVGDYTFTQFVEGSQVAQGTITVKRRIVTPGRLMAVVLLAGIGLLWLVRGKRQTE